MVDTGVAFKNHLEGARKQLDEMLAAVRRGVTRLRDTIQLERRQAANISDGEIARHIEPQLDKIRQWERTISDLARRAQDALRKVELLDRWVGCAEMLVRLRTNIESLSVGPEYNDGDNALYMSRVLQASENEIRERMARDGLSMFDEVDDYRARIESVARDVDRSYWQREQAFDREKATLETALAQWREGGLRLRSKYQPSKHDESYADLYIEALDALAADARELRVKLQVLQATPRDRDTERQMPGKKSIQQGKTDRASVQKRKQFRILQQTLLDIERDIQQTYGDSGADRDVVLTSLTARLAALAKQVEGAATAMSISVPHDLWTMTSDLLSRLGSSKEQDVQALIDMQRALDILPTDSELALLLNLCLAGHVTIEVRVRRGDGEA